MRKSHLFLIITVSVLFIFSCSNVALGADSPKNQSKGTAAATNKKTDSPKASAQNSKKASANSTTSGKKADFSEEFKVEKPETADEMKNVLLQKIVDSKYSMIYWNVGTAVIIVILIILAYILLNKKIGKTGTSEKTADDQHKLNMKNVTIQTSESKIIEGKFVEIQKQIQSIRDACKDQNGNSVFQYLQEFLAYLDEINKAIAKPEFEQLQSTAVALSSILTEVNGKLMEVRKEFPDLHVEAVRNYMELLRA